MLYDIKQRISSPYLRITIYIAIAVLYFLLYLLLYHLGFYSKAFPGISIWYPPAGLRMLFSVIFSSFIPFVEPLHSLIRLKQSIVTEYSLEEFIRSFNSATWYFLAALSIRYLCQDFKNLLKSNCLCLFLLFFYLAAAFSSGVHCLTLKYE